MSEVTKLIKDKILMLEVARDKTLLEGEKAAKQLAIGQLEWILPKVRGVELENEALKNMAVNSFKGITPKFYFDYDIDLVFLDGAQPKQINGTVAAENLERAIEIIKRKHVDSFHNVILRKIVRTLELKQ